MQKVVQFLEKYVQWVAVALGLAFCGFMAWTYVYKNPAQQSATIGGVTVSVTPGNVDQLISDGPASQLEQKYKSLQPGFSIPVPKATGVNLGPTTKPAQVSSAFDSWSFDLGSVAPTSGGMQTVVVQAMPTLPALKYVDQEPLRTVLLIVAANGNQTHQDEDSVTTFWSLPMADLLKAFKDSFAGRLPESLQLAQFIRANVVREELLPDGSWGPDVRVADAPLPPNTPPAPPYPTDVTAPNATQQFQAYVNWVNPLQQWVVSAAYPPVAYDRPDLQWQPLASWIPFRAIAQANETAPLDVAPIPQPQQQQPQPQPQQFIPGGGGGGPGGPAPGRGSVFGGGAIGAAAQGAIQQPQPQPVQQPTSQPTTNPTVVIPPIPQLQTVPNQGFNPITEATQGDVGLWFHDMNPQPGKTYRYRVQYVLYNPIFNQPNRAADPKMSLNAGIESPFSDWSDKVVVPARTRYWCAARQPASMRGQDAQVGFTVYSWHDGLWQEKDYVCSAGDEIGADEAAAGDFVTHWTLLDDERSTHGGSRHYVLLVPDDGGTVVRRDADSDTKNVDYGRFMRDFNNQQSLQQQQQQQMQQGQGEQQQPPGGGPPPIPPAGRQPGQ